MNVAERLKFFRESRNLTKSRLAQLAGVSQSYISDIEAGKKNPTVEVLSRICDALGISLVEFLSGETNETGLNPETARFAKIVEKLPAEERRALMQYVEARIKSGDKK